MSRLRLLGPAGGVAHALGQGTDAGQAWFLVFAAPYLALAALTLPHILLDGLVRRLERLEP